MHEIAVASGFGSTRRFNDAFRKTYGRAPRELRRRHAYDAAPGAFTVRLPYRAPFDFGALLNFFAARAMPGVEQVQKDRYLRAVAIGSEHGIIDVQHADDRVLLQLHGIATTSLIAVVQRVRELFDLDAPIADIQAVLSSDRALRKLLAKSPGVRVPGAWHGFELTVRAILGQQVSVRAATTLAGRIVARYGEPVDVMIDGLSRVPDRLFPDAHRLQRARVESMGIIGSRARTIRAVARAVADGELQFDGAQSADEVAAKLLSIKGIGDWTAQYVAMRAVKDPDAFPAADLGLLRAFDVDGSARMRPAELVRRAENWRPWRAYAALLLWGNSPAAGG